MRTIFITIITFFCLAVSSLSAQVPRKIAFQGALTDGDGRLLPNNQYDVVFRLYTQAEGGNSIWTSPTEHVTLINGLFNVMLGANPSDTAFSTLDVARPLWLGVSVAGAEMPTRFEITSAMYAITAQVAERARYEPPVGSVIPFFDTENMVPEGWLLCDGRQFSAVEYPLLRDALRRIGNDTTRTPDLRGQFLRGTDTTSRGRANNDPDFTNRSGIGQKIGSVQADVFQGHKHSLVNLGGSNFGEKASYGVRGGAAGTHWHLLNPSVLSDTQGSLEVGNPIEDNKNNGITRTSSETRPKNVCVNYIIKSK